MHIDETIHLFLMLSLLRYVRYAAQIVVRTYWRLESPWGPWRLAVRWVMSLTFPWLSTTLFHHDLREQSLVHGQTRHDLEVW